MENWFHIVATPKIGGYNGANLIVNDVKIKDAEELLLNMVKSTA